MSTPKIARALNHVAYPTTDTGATYRFYTEILGFKLVAAVRGDQDPESGTSKPHLHTFFAMRSGEVIAFFDIEGIEKPKRDHLPTWVRHFAMSVDSHEELMAWRQRLLDHGVKVIAGRRPRRRLVLDLLPRSQRRRARAHLPSPRAQRRRRQAGRADGRRVDQGARAADGAALTQLIALDVRAQVRRTRSFLHAELAALRRARRAALVRHPHGGRALGFLGGLGGDACERVGDQRAPWCARRRRAGRRPCARRGAARCARTCRRGTARRPRPAAAPGSAG